MNAEAQPVLRIVKHATEAFELLVSKPDEIKVQVVERDAGAIVIRVAAAKADLGKIIGQAGRTAHSLRILLTAMGAEHGLRIGLDSVPNTPEPPASQQ